MRPSPVRADDLRRRIAVESAALAEIEAKVAGATMGPRADMAATEGHLAAIEDRLAHCAEALGLVDVGLAAARDKVRELERSAVHLAGRVADAKIDREAAIRIVESLRAKVAAERERLAPAEARHRKELERLERRLATVLAYHPEARSNVLFDPTPGAGAAAKSGSIAADRALDMSP